MPKILVCKEYADQYVKLENTECANKYVTKYAQNMT
jgi:hypothetical protein